MGRATGRTKVARVSHPAYGRLQMTALPGPNSLGLREPGDPGLNEAAIAQTASNTFFTMMRTDSGLATFGRYSSDMGMTWGPLRSYTSQVGVLQAPTMI